MESYEKLASEEGIERVLSHPNHRLADCYALALVGNNACDYRRRETVRMTTRMRRILCDFTFSFSYAFAICCIFTALRALYKGVACQHKLFAGRKSARLEHGGCVNGLYVFFVRPSS